MWALRRSFFLRSHYLTRPRPGVHTPPPECDGPSSSDPCAPA
jgi:hypothetical protein